MIDLNSMTGFKRLALFPTAKSDCQIALYVTFAKWVFGGNAKDKLAILQPLLDFISFRLPFKGDYSPGLFHCGVYFEYPKDEIEQ